MKTQNHSTVDLLPRLPAPSAECHKIEKKWNLTTTTSFRHGYSIVLQLRECFSQLLIAVLTQRADATAMRSIDKPEIFKKAVKWKEIREARDALDFCRNLMKTFQVFSSQNFCNLLKRYLFPTASVELFILEGTYISPMKTFPSTSLMKNSERKSFAIEFNSPYDAHQSSSSFRSDAKKNWIFTSNFLPNRRARQ